LVALVQSCSAILQQRVPHKNNDLGSFTIPCSIEKLSTGRDLYDLGENINLMLLSMVKKLDGITLKPAKMTLTLLTMSLRF